MADLSLQIQREDEQVDYFDLLPDPILSLIFNKLFDGKSLCSCLLVSKRCASLVSEVDSISIQMNSSVDKKINHLKPKKSTEDSTKISKSFLKNPFMKFICKPVYLLQQVITGKKTNSSSKNGTAVDVLKHVGNTLKNFQEIQSLQLELPCHGGEIGINKNIPLLKWEAEFGKEMEKCAILGAASITDIDEMKKKKKKKEEEGLEVVSENENENEVQIFSDEELKLRIIWIISCLIASSARHNLMKKLVNQCPKLSNAVISDAGKQGKLSMNVEQINDLRDSIKISDVNYDSSKIELELASESTPEEEGTTTATATTMGYAGNLVMKLWYVKELELPKSGKVMKGATLVVIKPERKEGEKKENNNSNNENDGVNMWKAFEGEQVFEEAAKELLRRKEKRMYRLEMNSI